MLSVTLFLYICAFFCLNILCLKNIFLKTQFTPLLGIFLIKISLYFLTNLKKKKKNQYFDILSKFSWENFSQIIYLNWLLLMRMLFIFKLSTWLCIGGSLGFSPPTPTSLSQEKENYTYIVLQSPLPLRGWGNHLVWI